MTPLESIGQPVYDFSVMVCDIVEILQCYDKALKRMCITFEQMASVMRSVSYTAIINSKQYRKITSVETLFRLLAPHWNPVDCSLLVALVNATKCTAAIQRLNSYLSSRNETSQAAVLSKGIDVPPVPTGVDVPSVPTIVGDATVTTQVLQESPSNGSVPSYNNSIESDAPKSSPPQDAGSDSPHPLLPPDQPPEDNAVPVQCKMDTDSLQVTAKVDQEQITCAEYDRKTSFLCGILRLPRFMMQYIGVEPGCVALKWITSDGLLSHILLNALDDGDLQLLLDEKIISVQVGSDYTITVGSQRYWRVSTIKPLSQLCSEACITALCSSSLDDLNFTAGWL